MSDDDVKAADEAEAGDSAPKRRPHRRARARSTDHPRWPEFLTMLEDAVPFDAAARVCGLVPETIEQMMEDDPDVAAVVAAAKAVGEVKMLGEHRALARVGERTGGLEWRLERLYPKRYHLPTKITGVREEDGGAPVAVEVVRFPVNRLGDGGE